MQKSQKIGYTVLAAAVSALGGWIVHAVATYYLGWQSVSVDVSNLTGQPLRRVWVECAGPEGKRRQYLGKIAPDDSGTARFPVRYEGGGRWRPSYGASYGITLHCIEDTGHGVVSETVPRNRGSYVDFDVSTGEAIHILAGQIH